MTTTAERQFTVGQRIESEQMRDTVPIGTTFTDNSGGGGWSVRDQDGTRYLFREERAMHPMAGTRVDGFLTIASLPEPEPTRPEVGTIIRETAGYEAMPVGATFITPAGTVWTKIDDARFESGSTGRSKSIRTISVGRHKIHSYPGESGPAFSMEGEAGEGVESPLTPEMLAQFKQRFETVAWGSALNAGVETNSIPGAMERLEVPDSTQDIRPGMALWAGDRRLQDALPNGTMLMRGTSYSPTVWEMRSGSIVRMVGTADFLALVTIASIPGVESIDWGTPDADEVQRVHRFKRQAYDLGLAIKRRHSWCGEYERSMLRVGISEQAVANVPTPLSVEEVAALPSGTVLRLATTDQSLLVIRDDAMTNPARTRRLAGTVEGDWTRYGLIIVHDVTATRLAIPCASFAEMDSMPVGTRLLYSGDPRWATKDAEGRWTHRNSYHYRSTDLDLPQSFYSAFPHVRIPIRGGFATA